MIKRILLFVKYQVIVHEEERDIRQAKHIGGTLNISLIDHTIPKLSEWNWSNRGSPMELILQFVKALRIAVCAH